MHTQSVNVRKFKCIHGKINSNSEDGLYVSCPEEGLELVMAGDGGKLICGTELSKANYLNFEIECLEEPSLVFQIDLYKEHSKEYDMRIVFSILPHTKVTVPISMQLLDSQILFPPRTSGRLKMKIDGKPLLPEDIFQVKLTTAPCHKEQHIVIHKCYLSDSMPECNLENKPLMDEMGQWVPKQWDKKVKDKAQCNKLLKKLLSEAEDFDYSYQNTEWDKYGGWKEKNMTKTGWFHTEYDEKQKRWWLVDPEGNAFFSIGIDCVNPGSEANVKVMQNFCKWVPDSDGKYEASIYSRGSEKNAAMINYGIVNLIDAFGSDNWWDCWAKILKMYLYKWHVNTIGNWSSLDFAMKAKMPYVLPLDAYSKNSFPDTEVKIFRDFPDVYSEEYVKSAELFADALKGIKDDSYLIGYFMRNEPNWGFVYNLNIAEEMIASPIRSASREVFIKEMENKYRNINVFNDNWRVKLNSFEDLYKPIRYACQLSEEAKNDLISFSRKMITRYVEIPAKACKKVDPNHLNLGMRYAYITDPVMLSGYENFDVFSINCYKTSPIKDISEVTNTLKMPVMIGEFHFGSLDKGLTATGIKGVINQKERGIAYRYYMEQGIKSPYFLGAHYFMLNDQSCIGRFDGENYQIGFLDICMQEYSEMTEIISECNKGIYKVCKGSKGIFDQPPKEIPAVFC
ncbi:hypothetical protein [Clostridium oryzae]|uniref:Glycoside hydrolase family 42 N-terminal domain-containing protein n=1 Tax=Clostridium oryzae TaxID=1450648 RepID=A0A1V4IMT0_9CLOT|nr:hypothetical protein [Clostridium oryzae]OPJ61183.1 hypothetical protein CLORY_23950 [Clostridium oryzae]